MSSSSFFTLHFQKYQITYDLQYSSNNYTLLLYVKTFDGAPAPKGSILSLTRDSQAIANLTLDDSGSAAFYFELNDTNGYFYTVSMTQSL